ncbi:hypothetical protein ACLMAJ_26175 [Nocardia sp. KC 131]|uniref:glycosyltransferase family protein n=1 Tax=Nocardia arseniciresistens TaxID=3392119 RepID=UPI00398E4278
MTEYAVTIMVAPGNPHWQAFSEVAETVCVALNMLGHDCVLTHEVNIPGRRHIFFGARGPHRHLIPDDSILYNMEPIHPEAWQVDDGVLDLLRTHLTWDYSTSNITALKEHGIRGVQHVPVGHVDELERIPVVEEEDIDVLFIGGANHRRMLPITALRILGVNAQTHFGVYGPERDLLYARAKIVLNLHAFQGQAFEIVRVSYLLANGRFVVSETADAAETAGLESSVAFSGYNRLVDTCMHYLEEPTERARRARAGRAIMRARPAVEYVRRALDAQLPTELNLR